MSDFQITIIPAKNQDQSGQDHGQDFQVNQHGRGDAVVEKIEELSDVWDEVIAKLTELASKSQITAMASHYELSQIEFNLGVEAGLSVGLVTKGNASVSITFARKQQAGETGS